MWLPTQVDSGATASKSLVTNNPGIIIEVVWEYSHTTFFLFNNKTR
jgi:hypothetical protein